MKQLLTSSSEYIGQLEGEISNKSNEADDLRSENECLRAENGRLADLARMLLAHPAFNNMLEEMSRPGAQNTLFPPSAPLPPRSSHSSDSSQTFTGQTTQVQPSHHSAMSMAADDGLDFSAGSVTPTSNWNTGIDFDFNPQVFVVTDMPEEPFIGSDKLSDKATGTREIFPAAPAAEEKRSAPVIENPKPTTTAQQSETQCTEEDDDDLYASPAKPTTTSASEPENGYQLFGLIAPTKAFERFDLVTASDASVREDDIEITMARFAAMCANLDELSQSIEMMTTSNS